MHLFEGFDIAQIIHDNHDLNDDVISVSSDFDQSDVNDDYFDVVVVEVGEHELNFVNEYYGDDAADDNVDVEGHVFYEDDDVNVNFDVDFNAGGNDDVENDDDDVGDDDDEDEYIVNDDEDDDDVGVNIEDRAFDYEEDVNMENGNDDDDEGEHDVGVNIDDRAFDYDDEDEDVNNENGIDDYEDDDYEDDDDHINVNEYAQSLSASSSVHSNISSHHHDELYEVYDLVGPCGDDEWTVGGDAGLEIDIDGQETYLHHPPARPPPVHPLQRPDPLPSCPSDSLLVRRKRKAVHHDSDGSMAKRSRSESSVTHRKFTRARRVNARRVYARRVNARRVYARRVNARI